MLTLKMTADFVNDFKNDRFISCAISILHQCFESSQDNIDVKCTQKKYSTVRNNQNA